MLNFISQLGIQKKIVTGLSLVLLISFSVMLFFIIIGIEKNSEVLTSSILSQLESNNENSIKVLNLGFDQVANKLKNAANTSEKIVLDLYIESYSIMVKAISSQIFPLTANFDTDSADTIVKGITNNNKGITWIKYSTSKTPSKADIHEFGNKYSGDQYKIFSNTLKDEFAYLNIELQVNLSGLQALEEMNKIFTGINTENQNLISNISDNGAESLKDARKKAIAVAVTEKSSLVNGILILMIMILVIICILFYFASTLITLPIINAANFARQIATGDLTGKLDSKRKDELGILSQALNEVVDGLNEMVNGILSGVHTLTSSAVELTNVSEQLAINSDKVTINSSSTSSSATQASANLNNVNHIAEIMSENTNSIAHLSQEMSTSVSSAANSIDEMTLTIQEISQTCTKATSLTENAIENTNIFSKKIEELSSAANSIYKVVDMITEITERIRLYCVSLRTTR
jgi:methyl-accepting chemotaxis protein